MKRNRRFIDIWRQISRKDFYLPCFQNFVYLCSYFWSGSIVILIYAMDMIRGTTRNESAAFYGMIFINTISTVGAISTVFLLRAFKNKTVFLFSALGDAVCLFAVTLVTYLQSFDFLPKQSLLGLYCLVGAIIASSLGLLTITPVLSAELLPVKHRGIGGAIFVISLSFLYTSSMKLHGTFLLYTIIQTMCTFYIWKYVPETKGRTLTELEYFFNFGSFKRVDNEVITDISDELNK